MRGGRGRTDHSDESIIMTVTTTTTTTTTNLLLLMAASEQQPLLLPPAFGFECGETIGGGTTSLSAATSSSMMGTTKRGGGPLRHVMVKAPGGWEEGDDHEDGHEDDDDDDDDDDLPVTFHCTLPMTDDSDGYTLRFGCRRPSYGVLTNDEGCVGEDDFDNSCVDPNLFDRGYTLAGSTGFCVWAGARFMVEALALLSGGSNAAIDGIPQNNHSNLPLQTWQDKVCNGARVLELGAGVGFLGTALAFAGAEVLMTDLPTLVDNAIRPNLARNSRAMAQSSKPRRLGENHRQPVPPKWLTATDNRIDDTHDVVPIVEAHRIGKGWAAATPLDWSRPVSEQLSLPQIQAVDVIVASDCAWLASMLDMLLDTVAELFYHGAGSISGDDDDGPSSFLMAFQRRDRNVGSATFTTMDKLSDAVTKRGWTLQSRAWRPITLVDGTETVVFLVEIQSDST